MRGPPLALRSACGGVRALRLGDAALSCLGGLARGGPGPPASGKCTSPARSRACVQRSLMSRARAKVPPAIWRRLAPAPLRARVRMRSGTRARFAPLFALFLICHGHRDPWHNSQSVAPQKGRGALRGQCGRETRGAVASEQRRQLPGAAGWVGAMRATPGSRLATGRGAPHPQQLRATWFNVGGRSSSR